MQALIKEFINYLDVERGLASNTLESTAETCGNIQVSAGDATVPATASRATIVTYLLHLQKQGSYRHHCRRLAALKAFISFWREQY